MQMLVAEDELRMAQLLKRALTGEGHQVVVTNNGREALQIGLSSPFDVILLDVTLLGLDGITVAGSLREAKSQTPILMVTARDLPADVIRGLDSGADDYLTKPFSIDILLARIRAVSRRGVIAQPTFLQAGEIKLDPGQHVKFGLNASRRDNFIECRAHSKVLNCLELFWRFAGLYPVYFNAISK